MRLLAEFAVDMWAGAVPYTVYEVCRSMRADDVDVRLFVNAAPGEYREGWVHQTVPGWAEPHLRRVVSPGSGRITTMTQKAVLRRIKPGDVVYAFWAPIEFIHEAQARGAVVVGEMFNCHRAMARRILDDAYARLGWRPSHDHTDENVAAAIARSRALDFCFAASPMSARSLAELGIDERRILRTSYGWCPRRLDVPRVMELRSANRARPFTALFAGTISIRKGIHLLLQAWKKAAIPGARLVLAGHMDDEVRRNLAHELCAEGVDAIGFNRDMEKVYAEADVFVFPSLEEGGPLVTYEAMACGLPVLVSPMGAGTIARDGKDGSVIEPHNLDRWETCLRQLNTDVELRREYGMSARLCANGFTWDLSGERRTEMLRQSCHLRSAQTLPSTLPTVC